MAMTDPKTAPTTATSTTTATTAAARMPTLRSFTYPKEGILRTDSLQERTKEMGGLHTQGAPLSDEELDDIIHSIQNVYPNDTKDTIDFDRLRSTLQEIAHISHKDWMVTERNSKKLGKILFPADTINDNAAARQLLERILIEGNWDAADKHDASTCNPWAVLVTGVNGIRKTTSIYQDWWPELLQEALVPPPWKTSPLGVEEEDLEISTRKRKAIDDVPLEQLPSGSNSFFRQLDHMIATLCNEDFKALYCLTQKELCKSSDTTNPPEELVTKYSNLKAAIFSRYRTLSELLGAILLKEGQHLKSNCMMETSGRDVAMFHYVDHFFPKDYNKLALHFTINDLSQAQASVDRRMVHEIQAGISAIESKDDFRVIYANEGGPYGSEVLPAVQEASDAVWNNDVLPGKGVGQDWYKATIAINAHPTEPWTAQAVLPDGSLGVVFTFRKQS